MAKQDRPSNLGRGLAALLGDETEDYTTPDRDRPAKQVPVEFLHPSSLQPRRHFDEEAIKALADSIRENGVLQPILVRGHPEQADQFEIVAGERRWRAAQLAGLQKVPAVIRELDAKSAAAIALIENIQREDLNPLEEAAAFLRLIEEFDLTHQQVADSVGRSRAAVSNLLRLLDLADPVKKQVNQGLLNMGQARALLALIRHDQIEIAKLVVNRGLSVRETELLVKKALAKQSGQKSDPKKADPDVLRLENQISEKLGASVKIKSGKKGAGQLVIHFHSAAELDGILEHLTR